MSATDQRSPSWREALEVYRKPQVITMLFLGFSAGLPFLLVFSTLTVFLFEAGIARSTIGFFSWIGITYSIKVLWAPVVDSVRLPVLYDIFGQRRSWILLGQIGIAVGLAAIAITDPSSHIALLACFGLLVAFSSATQDISIDAYRIESAIPKYQAAMSAAYVFGYRLALLVAGAGALYLAEYFGWVSTYVIMAALMSVGIVTVIIIAEPERREGDSLRNLAASQAVGRAARLALWFKHSVVGPFADFFGRHGLHALIILLLIALYRVSDITMGVMANPFYLEMGFTKPEIADVTKIFGFFMTIAGSALGGLLVVKFGVRPILLVGAVMVASTNLLFAWMALSDPTLWRLAVVVSADNLSGGLAVVAFIAYLSGLTSTAYTATQYALFSSLMTLPGKFVGGFSGVIVDTAGYPWFFTLAAGLGVPAIILVCVIWFYDNRREVEYEKSNPPSG